MIRQQLIQDPTIQALEKQFEAQGVNFTPVLDKAIANATAGIGNPMLRDVLRNVVVELVDELKTHLAGKQPRTWAGIALRWIANLI